MRQTSDERCAFPIPIRWLRPGDDLSRPNHGDQCVEHPLMRSERPPKANSRPPNSPACRHADRLVLASRPPSKPVLTSNPHSARGTASP